MYLETPFTLRVPDIARDEYRNDVSPNFYYFILENLLFI